MDRSNILRSLKRVAIGRRLLLGLHNENGQEYWRKLHFLVLKTQQDVRDS